MISCNHHARIFLPAGVLGNALKRHLASFLLAKKIFILQRHCYYSNIISDMEVTDYRPGMGNNPEPATREQVLELMKEKDNLEEEIKALHQVLESQKVGMDDSLVDQEGFPRSDIDVYQVRKVIWTQKGKRKWHLVDSFSCETTLKLQRYIFLKSPRFFSLAGNFCNRFSSLNFSLNSLLPS